MSANLHAPRRKTGTAQNAQCKNVGAKKAAKANLGRDYAKCASVSVQEPADNDIRGVNCNRTKDGTRSTTETRGDPHTADENGTLDNADARDPRKTAKDAEELRTADAEVKKEGAERKESRTSDSALNQGNSSAGNASSENQCNYIAEYASSSVRNCDVLRGGRKETVVRKTESIQKQSTRPEAQGLDRRVYVLHDMQSWQPEVLQKR